MLNHKNELLQKSYIKIQLEFINKSNNIQKYENLKRKLLENFYQINISQGADTGKSKKYFLKFYELSDYKNNALLNEIQPDCKILFSLNEESKQEKIISTYNNYLSTLVIDKRATDRLVFLSSNCISNDKITDNIEIISEEYTLEILNALLTRLITDLIFSLKAQLESNTDEIDKKTKNLQSIKRKSEIYIILGEFHASCQSFLLLSEFSKQSNDNLLFAYSREGIASSLATEELAGIEMHGNEKRFYLHDYKFNDVVEANLDSALQIYKKSKLSENVINCYFKFAYYYLLFRHKTKSFLDTMKRINDEVEFLQPSFKIFYLLKVKDLFEYIGMKRKAIFYLYLIMGVCLENYEMMNLLPFIFKEICEAFGVNNTSIDKIENPTQFLEIQKTLKKMNWKKIQFNYLSINVEDRKEMKETSKKRIDKENKLYVLDRKGSIKKFILDPKWEPIQFNLFLNLMNFYKSFDKKKKFSYTISLLQTLSSFLTMNEQKNMISSIITDSGLLQEKLFLNLPKLPVLIKIIPCTSDIKFDIIKNSDKNKSDTKNIIETELDKDVKQNDGANSKINSYDKIFLYNPWEKDENVNYYWTAESSQRVYVELYNPLAVELRVNKVILLFEGNRPFSFPTSTTIPPNSAQGITCKIKPIERGITAITGIKYEIFNASGIQFVDKNGNGLYSNSENLINDSSTGIGSKKDKISLTNIKIYPEIPQINLKILDSSSKIINGSLDLFDYQYYNFSLLLENISEYAISDLTVNIYAYKKDDYKIILDEIKIKPNSKDNIQAILIDKEKSYRFDYNYLHKKYYKKLEFKIYYTSCKDASSQDYQANIKPYLYYEKSLHTLKLVELYDLKVIPMLSNNMIHLITMSDPEINKDYSKFFCSDKYYVSFSIRNCNDDTLTLQIYSKDNLIKEEVCDNRNLKEISIVIDSHIKMSEFTMYWEFNKLNDVRGKIDFNQIFNEFSFKFKSRINFEISSEENIQEEDVKNITITYGIKNNTDRKFKNLKLFIYLYQVYDDDKLIFNNQLNDEIFFEGSLYTEIIELKEYETKNIKLKLYPKMNEHISTTCLVVDSLNEIVYMSPISKTFYLNHI